MWPSPGAPTWTSRGTWRRALRWSKRRQVRLEPEAGASLGRRLVPQRPAQLLHHAPAQGQAEAGAREAVGLVGGSPAVERPEQLLRRLGRNARAGVAHREFDARVASIE